MPFPVISHQYFSTLEFLFLALPFSKQSATIEWNFEKLRLEGLAVSGKSTTPRHFSLQSQDNSLANFPNATQNFHLNDATGDSNAHASTLTIFNWSLLTLFPINSIRIFLCDSFFSTYFDLVHINRENFYVSPSDFLFSKGRLILFWRIGKRKSIQLRHLCTYGKIILIFS